MPVYGLILGIVMAKGFQSKGICYVSDSVTVPNEIINVEVLKK